MSLRSGSMSTVIRFQPLWTSPAPLVLEPKPPHAVLRTRALVASNRMVGQTVLRSFTQCTEACRYEHRFRAGIGFGVRRPAFHPSQSSQSEEDLVVPPVAGLLRWEALVQQLDLAVCQLRGAAERTPTAARDHRPTWGSRRPGRGRPGRPSAGSRRWSGGPGGHRGRTARR